MSDRAALLDRRRPQKGDQRRTALLAALRALIEERPFEEISISDISTRAGVTRSAFYFYFANLPTAVAALTADLYDEVATTTESFVGASGDPRAALARMLREVFASWEQRAPMFRALLEARWTDAGVRRMLDEDRHSFVAPLAAWIEDERAAGRAADGPPGDVLATVLLELNDRALESLVLGPTVPRERFVDTLVTVWIRSIYGGDPS